MTYQAFFLDAIDDIFRILSAQSDDFALIGGLAFSILVEPKATMDIDILIASEKSDLQSLKELFESSFDHVFYSKIPVKSRALSIERLTVIRQDREIPIDFIRPPGFFTENAMKRKKILIFKNTSIPIVTIEDLYILKQLSPRIHDQADCERIDEQFKDHLDFHYITRMSMQFQTKTFRDRQCQ